MKNSDQVIKRITSKFLTLVTHVGACECCPKAAATVRRPPATTSLRSFDMTAVTKNEK